jgi:hypothetical protein
VRGPAVDCDPLVWADFPTYGSAAHRLTPSRVMQVLELLVKES